MGSYKIQNKLHTFLFQEGRIRAQFQSYQSQSNSSSINSPVASVLDLLMIFWAPTGLGSFTSVLPLTAHIACLVGLCHLHSQVLLSLVSIPRSGIQDIPCNWGFHFTRNLFSLSCHTSTLPYCRSLCSFQNPSNQGSPQQLGLQLLLPNPRQWQDCTCLQPIFRGLAVDSETELQHAHSELTVDPHWAQGAWFLAESF